MPVANTTPWASPPVQLVPLKTRSRATNRGTSTSRIEAERSLGTDSPVRADKSTSMAPRRRRMSAAMRAPSSSSTTSPGTSSAASMSRGAPSRITLACCGMYSASASTARSACTSCTKAKVALRTMMNKTATATTVEPTTIRSAAAIHSSNASGCVNCRTSSRGQRRPPWRRSSLRPYCTRRRLASLLDSPRRELCRSRSSIVAASSGFRPGGRIHASCLLLIAS